MFLTPPKSAPSGNLGIGPGGNHSRQSKSLTPVLAEYRSNVHRLSSASDMEVVEMIGGESLVSSYNLARVYLYHEGENATI